MDSTPAVEAPATTKRKKVWTGQNTRPCSVAFPRDLKIQAQAAAYAEGRSLSGYVMEAIRDRLKKRDHKDRRAVA